MNFINKINKYLIEQYPLIWNTRLVWMLGVNIVVHLLFFVIGFLSVNGLDDLKKQDQLNDFFFDTSNVYYNVLISIFILLIWFIFYLRNNAFKNLYAVKKGMLFQQYCIIFIIIIISITQFYSFKKGLIIRVKSLYSWQEVDKDIKIFNNTSLFLMQNQDDYEIDKKQYPAPFPLKVAVQRFNNQSDNIDTTRAYLQHKNEKYQFYEINKTFYKSDVDTQNYANESYRDDFKYRDVKDVTAFKELINPSLLNYSKEKFSYGQDSLDVKNRLDFYQKILNGKEDFKIKKQLKEFLILAKKYDTEHNLEVENWFALINNKPNYLLTNLINTNDPSLNNFNKVKYNRNPISKKNDIPYSKTLFFSFNNTDNFFKNVYQSYHPDFNSGLLYFLIVFSIILSILLFVFKTTNLKSLLLSFVASLIILVLIVWLMSSSRNLFGYTQYAEYFIMLFISFVIILFSILSYVLRWKKIVISILWSLVLFAVPTFFFFAAISYSKYLKDVYYKTHRHHYSYKSSFETWFDTYGFLVIVSITILTIYLYSLFVRRLKARAS